MKNELRVKRVYRVNKTTDEKVLVGYLGDVTLNKVRFFTSEPIREEEYYPEWYYEYSVNPGKFVEFIPKS